MVLQLLLVDTRNQVDLSKSDVFTTKTRDENGKTIVEVIDGVVATTTVFTTTDILTSTVTETDVSYIFSYSPSEPVAIEVDSLQVALPISFWVSLKLLH